MEECGSVPPEQIQKEQHQKALTSGKCLKCKKINSSFVFRTESICWDCFLILFNKKFKANLNLGRKARDKSENVLLALSGGPSSRCMLHALSEESNARTKKDTYFNTCVIYIDEGTLFNMSLEQRLDYIYKIKEIVAKYNYPLYCVPLEAIFSSDFASLSSSFYFDPSNANLEFKNDFEFYLKRNDTSLKQLFQSCATNTTKEDLQTHLRNHLLAQFAKFKKIGGVLLGSSATRIASNIISSTAKGRGFMLSEEVAPVDRKYIDVSFIHPMRESLAEEIGIYNYFKKLDLVIFPSFSTKSLTPKFSIDSLSENFIVGLQKEFPHTVHTLIRSASKLTMPEKLRDSERCSICSNHLSLEEIESISKSQKLSALTKSSSKKEEEDSPCKSDTSCGNEYCCGETCSSNKRMKTQDISEFMDELVCYSCSRLVREINPLFLPFDFKSNAQTLFKSISLREQIKDFLLE